MKNPLHRSKVPRLCLVTKQLKASYPKHKLAKCLVTKQLESVTKHNHATGGQLLGPGPVQVQSSPFFSQNLELAV
jgi:hypothetical protein